MPLGIGYLAGMLAEQGHEISVVDMQTPEDQQKTIPYSKFDMVAISSDTPRFKIAMALGQQARSCGVPVVIGGYHSTFIDQEALEKDAADYIIRGEGEYSLGTLLETLEHGGDLKEIPGISFGLNGQFYRNETTPLVQNLDELPYPKRDIFDPGKYHSIFYNRKMTTMLTSRGCPFDCYFCAATQFAGVKWRTRSLDSIFDEIEKLIGDGYGAFTFLDDNFTLSYRRTMQFCEELIAKKWDIRWWCFSRVDSVVRHPDMVEKMAEAGNRGVFLGLESGNQETLDYFQKKTTLEQQKQAVNILNQYNIDVHGSFILGEPHESKKMIKQTIKFSRQLDLDVCQFSVLTPYPGSRLYRELEENQELVTKDWDLYDGAHLVFKNPSLSAKSVTRLLRFAYRRFYLRLSNIPSSIVNFIRHPKSIGDFLKNLYIGISIFRKLNKTKQ